MLTLRSFQKKALEYFALDLPSHHLLCIASTGSGKSLIYEQMATQSKLRILLISPLLALARQQQRKLQTLNVLVGMKSAQENTLACFASGVWIMSPENLASQKTKALLYQWKPHFLVVDECHCIWEWEHFRPAFRLITDLFLEIPFQKSLWLSATLSLKAQEELKAFFSKKNQTLFQIGDFCLPQNLFLSVQKKDFEERLFTCTQMLQQKKPYLVFVQTRILAERLHRLVLHWEKNTVFYHAGMSQEERKNTEEQIKKEQIRIIIATTAFGMGMDYAFIQDVILLQPAFSILSLVQMIGRACRNQEKKSTATIFWDENDLSEFIHDPAEWQKKQVAEYLREGQCRIQGLHRFFGAKTDASCHQCDYCAPVFSSL
jgi:ATP-dependent DNA helicase RecQ